MDKDKEIKRLQNWVRQLEREKMDLQRIVWQYQGAMSGLENKLEADEYARSV